MYSRGEITTSILNFLAKSTLTARAHLLADLKSNRSVLIRKQQLRKELKRSENDYYDFLEKQRFHNYISRLKKQGLIVENSNGLMITRLGKEKLKSLKSKILPRKSYPKEKVNEIKIVSFDIPEKERRKRDWLRSVLKSLDFYMLHHSVWIGKRQLPTQLIMDLKNLGILNNIHIFGISKEGTLADYPINID